MKIRNLLRKLNRRDRHFALANSGGPQLGEMTGHGHLSLNVNADVVLPVASRYLLWTYGADQYHAKLCTAVTRPLGISPDSPSGTIPSATQLTVYALGAKRGSLIGIASGNITHGNLLCAAAAGKLQDLTLAGAGTFYVVGLALKDVLDGAEIPFVPVFPYTVTQ